MIIRNQKGMSMYVEVSGNVNSDHTVFFLNGVMASVNSWAPIKSVFEKQGFKVVCHDFVGQLKSEPLSSRYRFVDHGKDVVYIMDALGIDRAMMIGTSYGGEIAMRLAIDFPERVSSIAVINSTSQTDELMVETLNHWKRLCDVKDKEIFFWGMASSIYGVSYMKNHLDAMKLRSKAMNQLPESYFSSLKHLLDTFISDVNITNELSKIQCPSLIVCGDEDRLKPVLYSKIIANSVSNSEFLLIVDCGHVTIFEQTDSLTSALLGFAMKLRR